MSAETPADDELRVLRPRLVTIGHSDLAIDDFVERLLRQRIDTLVDVRARPHSRRHPQYRQPALVAGVNMAGITYVWHGEGLGADGSASYVELAARAEFRDALARVVRLSREGRRIALCCAEGDPLDCHRTILVTRRMRSALEIVHVLRDGHVESNESFEERLLDRAALTQPELFDDRPARIEAAYDVVGRRIVE